MHVDDLRAAVDAALDGRRLIEHPFYRRWVAGGVGVDEIRAYTAQYRHFEASLPGVLTAAAAGFEQPAARAALERNLADETGTGGDGPSHLELLDRLATSIDAPPAVPTAATVRLVSAYAALAAQGPVAGTAAVLAYETQVPELAAAKSAALQAQLGLDRDDVAFWEVHAGLDGDHAGWGLDALAAAGATPHAVGAAAGAAAAAWWDFLDEREAVRPVGAGRA
ncbi:MAG TPA: iron-containing redox enzyme family protein [Candidatus Dormibacteraeota bacterium]|nr:iron-containing redox enzyme family protein [Candidatus Dormibacteraeota bacterium]